MQLGAQDSASWPNYYISNARAAQAATLPGKGPFSVDTLGMATAYDLGDMGSPYPPSHVHSRNKTEVGRRLALALLHTQYALQFPASPALINLSTSLNWSPPRLLGVAARSGASDGTLAASFALDAPAGAPRPGLLLLDTPGCWECCARAGHGAGARRRRGRAVGECQPAGGKRRGRRRHAAAGGASGARRVRAAALRRQPVDAVRGSGQRKHAARGAL